MTSITAAAAPTITIPTYTPPVDTTPSVAVTASSIVNNNDSQDQLNPVQNQQAQTPITFAPIDSSNDNSADTSSNSTQQQGSSLPSVTFSAVNPDLQPPPVSAYNALAQANSSTILGGNVNIQA